MVSLTTVTAQNTAFLSTHPLVAVVVGGTSGISEYAIRSLITTHASLLSSSSSSPSSSPPSLRIYIIGRNATAAQKTITDCKAICPGPEFEIIFVKAEDLSLLKDVDRVCEEIVKLEREKEGNGRGKARVDWLVMSQSNSVQSFNGRKLTSEGLDVQFSLHYYSRMRFVTQLLPLLLNSTHPRGAHITSIYAAGMEATLHANDLSLRQPTNYTFATVRSHVAYMTTLFFESLVQRHPGKLVATHVFPGLVITPGMYLAGYPFWFRVLRGVFGGLGVMRLVSMGSGEAGSRMVWTMAGEEFVCNGDGKVDGKGGQGIMAGTDGVKGGGAYAVGRLGDVIETEKAYKEVRKGDLKDRVWKYTWNAFEVIERGEVFED
ncbi:hypothetical protein ONS95_003331 [Cadophora gregata]|uniref:uncharacterized protein n=1 Tax=Cadophora gregata TaxID=51156 RepID=UPI0026DDC7BB|nr:uncharacterized protein ONS95_003331 [Cadophora gregata]KAK0108526.1 hypothetical protein ONS95_003331 [Cadophora gregata]KAK0108878.1 hypothetical protein ONS96_002715 [Cadophora gregata f. sp. sojae]